MTRNSIRPCRGFFGTRNKVAMLVAALAVLISGNSAQSDLSEQKTREALSRMLGTVNSSYTADAANRACKLTFKLIGKDTILQKSEFVIVNLQIALQYFSEDASFLGLDIYLQDIVIEPFSVTPSGPAMAFIISETGTTEASLIGVKRAEEESAVTFEVSALKTIMDGLNSGELTLALARTKGGAYLKLPIDTRVDSTNEVGERTRSGKAASEFRVCATELIRAGIKKRLN